MSALPPRRVPSDTRDSMSGSVLVGQTTSVLRPLSLRTNVLMACIDVSSAASDTSRSASRPSTTTTRASSDSLSEASRTAISSSCPIRSVTTPSLKRWTVSRNVDLPAPGSPRKTAKPPRRAARRSINRSSSTSRLSSTGRIRDRNVPVPVERIISKRSGTLRSSRSTASSEVFVTGSVWRTAGAVSSRACTADRAAHIRQVLVNEREPSTLGRASFTRPKTVA